MLPRVFVTFVKIALHKTAHYLFSVTTLRRFSNEPFEVVPHFDGDHCPLWRRHFASNPIHRRFCSSKQRVFNHILPTKMGQQAGDFAAQKIISLVNNSSKNPITLLTDSFVALKQLRSFQPHICYKTIILTSMQPTFSTRICIFSSLIQEVSRRA